MLKLSYFMLKKKQNKNNSGKEELETHGNHIFSLSSLYRKIVKEESNYVNFLKIALSIFPLQ